MSNSIKLDAHNSSQFPNLPWRLIPYQQASAGLNMAIDSYFLNSSAQLGQLTQLTQVSQIDQTNQIDGDDQDDQISASNEPGRSILRFYGWQKPTISLGYHQRRIPAHWSTLAQDLELDQDLDLVRRPSGGRAVLHAHDLTYAIVTRAKFANRNETYRYICEFLIKGFARLGIKVDFGSAQRNYLHHPSCFNTATNADLVIADGRKLVGSAQVYRHGWVLQHGAIAIQPDYDLLQKIFKTDVPVVGVAELLGSNATRDGYSQEEEKRAIANLQTILINALTQAANEHFQVELVSQPLTNAEIVAIEMLISSPLDCQQLK